MSLELNAWRKHEQVARKARREERRLRNLRITVAVVTVALVWAGVAMTTTA